MAQIKNIHLLDNVLKRSDIDKMETAALMHKRYSNMDFKIVNLTDSKITFQIVQSKSPAENYATPKRLIEIVHETFDKFFSGKKIFVHPVPYKEAPANKVDSGWISKKMLATGTRVKDISNDTGIDNTQLTSLVTGRRPLSQPMKALFWFYFAAKEKEVISS